MPEQNLKSLVVIENARCRVGRSDLLEIEYLHLKSGQRWAVFGGNGSGKSLLAQLISGRRRESASYVRYGNGFNPRLDIHCVSFEEQQRLWEQDNRLDMSEYSEDAQDQGTTVETLIKSSRDLSDKGDKLFQDLVSMLGLENILAQGIRFLSSGQVRKTLIAKAFYAARGEVPQLIILDDVLETVDMDSKQRILASIEKFYRPNNCVVQLCRRRQDLFDSNTHLAIMESLRLIQQGVKSPDSLNLLAMTTQKKNPPIADLTAVQENNDRPVQSTEPLIEMIRVDAGYGKHKVLKQFSWNMSDGDHVLIEGPNGCGKSTLLGLIAGENHKAYGQDVKLFGRLRGSGETVWEVKSHFGIVSNEIHNKYQKGWKLLDVVMSGFFDSVGLYETGGTEQLEQARAWLAIVDLESQVSRYYQEISFGQQRLVLLARAMVKKPRILILDEPCVGLDDFYRCRILNILDKIAAVPGTQLIYVSHVSEERPDCLNSRLSFLADGHGGYDIEQGLIDP